MVLRMLNPLSVAEAVENFLAARRAERLSVNTLGVYRNALNRFTRFIGEKTNVKKISPVDIRNFLSEQDDVSDRTLLHYHTALSSLWTWLVNEKEVDDHIVRRVAAPKPEDREVLPLTYDQIVKLLLATDRSKPYKRKRERMVDQATQNAARDRAIIFLLLDTGLRVSEMCSLKMRDLQENGVTVMGKGKKERWVPYSETTYETLLNHLEPLNRKPDDFVFPIHRGAVQDLFERLSARTGIPNVHAHRFRHTFAINYIRNGGDPYTLQKILGHTTLEMVKRYLAISRTDIDRAHQKYSPVTNFNL